MRIGKSMMLGAALVLAACGGKDAVEDAEYVEATPDLAGTVLEINGEAAAEEGAALIAEGFGVNQGELNGQGPEFLESARVQVKALNSALKEAITPIVELVNAGGAEAQPGDVRVYGPEDRANATFRFTIKKATAARFVWKLEARPLGSTDDAAYKVVAAGGLTKGPLSHRGRGTIGINLDNLKAVAPNTTGQGKLMASFAHTAGNDKTLAYRLSNFTPNPANHEAVTGAFVGHRRQPSGITRVRVFGKYSLKNTATTAKENVFATLRHVPGLGGRADVYAAGGDIAADKYFVGSACWDRQEMEKFRILRQCTKGQPMTSCVVVEGSELGTRAACPADMRGEDAPPAGDPNDGTQEPDAPVEPEPVPGDVTAEL
ncbi:hypothetical protein [Hyalangium rubrum]|uniref:Lipoprotein n=1 Tax=Hyalangium rubrum TaxID=3103134 RepID=A0ABU5HGN2_9BACT|nr:hypothetical protein [Hyalangium sp. s54d21]MDY7232019.1 hypothetical protein [Hyalangium sp. s54d21]